MNFSEALAYGKTGESRIAVFLRRFGWNVMPAYEKETGDFKGPVFYQASGPPLVAPDMLLFGRDGRIAWVEAKRKSAFSWDRAGKTWVTGIDIKHYEDYIRISKLTPIPLWILFLHEGGTAKDTPTDKTSPTGLFGRALFDLMNREHHRSAKWGKRGMVYWDVKDLIRLADIEQVCSRKEPLHE